MKFKYIASKIEHKAKENAKEKFNQQLAKGFEYHSEISVSAEPLNTGKHNLATHLRNLFAHYWKDTKDEWIEEAEREFYNKITGND